MASKLPPAYDWKGRDIKDWNALTFRAYMKHLHEEKFKIPYVTNSIAAENKNIKRTYEEYGKEVTKAFIDICFDEYRPSPQYPNLSFFFMYTYMREKCIPRAIKKVQAEKAEKTAESNLSLKEDEVMGWF